MRLAAVILVLAAAACQDGRGDFPASSPTVAGRDGELAAVLVVVPREGRRYHGFTRILDDANAMRRRARMLCGSERCEVVREWHRGECAALGLGQNEIHWNTVRINTEGEATTRVMGACRSRDQECRVVESGCY